MGLEDRWSGIERLLPTPQELEGPVIDEDSIRPLGARLPVSQWVVRSWEKAQRESGASLTATEPDKQLPQA